MSELKQTDLSKRLRAEANSPHPSCVNKADLRAAAEEIERYYTGMLNWKATAESQSRTQPEATKPAQDLSAAILAMNRAKLLPIWDNDVPHKLHVELDVIFKALAALASPADALVAGDSAAMKTQLNQIGKSIGYGRAIQMLGQLWDDMLQAHYGIAARHQESMFRRDDIERIEAGLPIGRKVVYFQKRGRKEKITAWMPFDAEIPNVAHIISDTPLYGRQQEPAIQAQKDGHG